eukprot:10867039-Ditylum_brightwellii.AAC.1
MWQYRNHVLQSGGANGIFQITTALNSRICFHYNRGQKGVPSNHKFLFKTGLQQLLAKSAPHRTMWLECITYARLKNTRVSSQSTAEDNPDLLLLQQLSSGGLLSKLSKFQEKSSELTVKLPPSQKY